MSVILKRNGSCATFVKHFDVVLQKRYFLIVSQQVIHVNGFVQNTDLNREFSIFKNRVDRVTLCK